MAQTEVASDWALIPSGLGAGDSFRLLIVTSTRQTAESSTIGDYDTVVQDDVSSNGHAAIQSYSANFKMLGCTSTTSAITNTSTGSSDTAAPIYWLNGAKVADNYSNLYDGSWDSNAPKYPSGENAPDSGQLSRMFIGCRDNGTKSANTLGDGTVSSGYPGFSGFELSSSVAVNTNTLRYYGLSEIFQVASGSNTTPAVDSIAFSSAGADNTFAIGDAVSATVTFSAAVTVTGTPQLEIDVSGTPTALDYSSGSGTTALVFTGYTVAANDEDANGLSIAANKLTLNSGTIKASAGDNPDAVLDHAAVAASANHKVDGIRPTLVTTGDNAPRTSTDGTKIILTFSENVDLQITATFATFFPVSVAGTAATVDLAEPHTHNSIELTLASTDTVAVGNTVTAVLLSGVVADLAGNQNAALAATSVLNTVVTLPGKPTGLTVGTVTPTKIPLSWTASTNAGGYSVERAPDVSGSAGTWAAVWSGLVTSYTDTDLTPGTKYHYRVSGINSAGTGAASDSVSGTTAALPVVTISALNATVTEGTQAVFSISRTGNTGDAISVHVVQSGSADMGVVERTYTVNLSAGTDLSRVGVGTSGDAVDEENGSATVRLLTDSDGVTIVGYTIGTPASATVTVEDDDTVPGTPVVSALGHDTKLVLNWPMPAEGTSSITGYDYRYKTTAGAEATWSTWTDTGLSGSDASNDFEITGLTNGTDYTVEVRAESLAGYSIAGSANATPTPPPIITSVAITSDPGADNTYIIGDAFVVTITFDKNITLTSGSGSPPIIAVLIGSGSRTVPCLIPTPPTMELVCNAAIDDGDGEDSDGISLPRNTLATSDRMIVGPLGQIANLDYSRLADDSNHKVDGVKPTVSSAEAMEDSLTIKFSEALDEDSTPATSAFTLNVDSGTAPTVSSVDIDGSNVTLSLSAAVDTSKTYTIDYAAPMTSPIKDLVGNAAEDVSTQSVSTEDTTAPELTEATTLSSNAVLLSYDEALDPNSVPDKSQFTVKVGETVRTLSTVGPHGTMGIRLSLGSTFRPGDMLTVSYAVPSTNPIQDAASNDAVGFTDEAVTNNLAATAPDALGHLETQNVFTATNPVQEFGDILLLGWTTPWHNGRDITKYQYRYAPGTSIASSVTWVDIPDSAPGLANANAYRVTELISGTEYTFEVRAVNGIGNGAEATATATTPMPTWELTLTDSNGNAVTELVEGGASATVTVRITYGVRFSTDQTVQLERGAGRLGNGRIQGAGGADTITIPAGESSGSLDISAPEPGGTASYVPPRTFALSATHAGRQVGESIDLTFVDDEPPPAASIARAPTEVGEGEDIEIRISLNPPTLVPIGIRLAVTDPAGALSGTPPAVSVLGAFETASTVTLTAADNEVQNDGAREVTFTLALSPPDIFTLGEPSSVTVTVLDNDTPPSAPRNLAAEARDGEARLTWQAPLTDNGQAVTGYEYRHKAGTGSFGAWTDILGSNGNTTEYTVTGLANGTLYTFEVQAENTAGQSGPSNQASVTPAAGDSPAPVLMSATTTALALGLTYDENLDASSEPAPSAFTVTVDGASRGVTGVALDETKVLLTLASAVRVGETVTVSYTVPAMNPLRDEASNPAAAFSDHPVTNEVPATAPEAPTGLEATPGDGLVTLRWTASAYDGGRAVTGHQYRQKTTGDFGSWQDIELSAPGEANATSYPVTSLMNDTAYTFEVQARNAEGDSGPSNQASATPVAGDTTAPVLRSATTTALEVGLTYDENLDAGSEPAPSAFTVTVDGASRAVTGVSVDEAKVLLTLASAVRAGETVTVSYTVPMTGPLRDEARNPPASFSDHPVTNGTPATVPEAPANLEATPGDGSVTLRWTASAYDGGRAVTGHQYCREEGTSASCTAESDWRDIVDSAPGGANATGYTVSDLTNGTGYTFRVRARNAEGESAPSPAAGTTPDASDTASPELVRALSAGFGRMVGGQALRMVSAHLEGGGGSQVTVGGERLGGPAEAALARLEAASRDGDEGRPRAGREVLHGSSFRLQSGGEETGAAAWGRIAAGRFETRSDGVATEGEVTTGMVGADVTSGRWLVGGALSHARGKGSFATSAQRAEGESEVRLTALHPYARVRLGERMSAWGLAGYGKGELTLSAAGGERVATGLRMRMGAVGARGTVVPAPAGGGFELALKTDALWMRVISDAAEGLPGARADARRLRLVLDASRVVETAGGATLTPRFEAGVRRDGGDTQRGAGLEVGAGLRYARSAVTVEGRVRALALHEASGYEEWGASGSVRVEPSASGRGLSLTLAPTWGNAASAVERLWSLRDPGGLAANAAFEARARLDAELGYGLKGPRGVGVATPWAGLGLAREGERAWRAGARWNIAPRFTLGLEATRREPSANDPPEHRLMLRGALRW